LHLAAASTEPSTIAIAAATAIATTPAAATRGLRNAALWRFQAQSLLALLQARARIEPLLVL